MNKRIALITGASRCSGIGRAICRALAEDGVDIFFTTWLDYDRQMPWGANIDEPDEIHQEIVDFGVRCGFGID